MSLHNEVLIMTAQRFRLMAIVTSTSKLHFINYSEIGLGFNIPFLYWNSRDTHARSVVNYAKGEVLGYPTMHCMKTIISTEDALYMHFMYASSNLLIVWLLGLFVCQLCLDISHPVCYCSIPHLESAWHLLSGWDGYVVDAGSTTGIHWTTLCKTKVGQGTNTACFNLA